MSFFPLFQTLTAPAPFADETSCQCRAPHEKLTIAQARLGTPGMCRGSISSTLGAPEAQALPHKHLSVLAYAFHLEARRPACYLGLSGIGEENSSYRVIICCLRNNKRKHLKLELDVLVDVCVLVGRKACQPTPASLKIVLCGGCLLVSLPILPLYAGKPLVSPTFF